MSTTYHFTKTGQSPPDLSAHLTAVTPSLDQQGLASSALATPPES